MGILPVVLVFFWAMDVFFQHNTDSVVGTNDRTRSTNAKGCRAR